ncbi:MAG TPA: hypothetical protein PKL04_06035 [Methanofastidiosum sp.]|nr:hypothetical protein [Methanofastidiosum sp.]
MKKSQVTKLIAYAFIILFGFGASLYYNYDSLVVSKTEISEDLGNTLNLDMVKVTDTHRYNNPDNPYEIYEKIQNQKEYILVPDYKVKINFSEPAIENNIILFRFDIKDEGIQKLNEETYFYRVYVVQKDENVEYAFPDNPYYSYEKWDYQEKYRNNKKINTVAYQKEKYFFPRETLLNLEGEYFDSTQNKYLESKIYLSFDALEAGTWDVYVFVFDEKYYVRGTETELDKKYSNYCVGYNKLSITYTGIEEPPKKTQDKTRPVVEFLGLWAAISFPLYGFFKWRNLL